MKRLFDIVFSVAVLVVAAPFLTIIALLVFFNDGGPVFYRAYRVGLRGEQFRLFKFRSMIVDADKIPVDTTSSNDRRLTAVGKVLRRGKLDELPQFWNVLRGEMSVVGPRPQVPREVAIYTEVEKELLRVRPGISDLSSIVFSDLETIVKDHPDPDIAYNQLVRPWKSRLGLFYVNQRTFGLDIAIIWLTLLNGVSRAAALRGVVRILKEHGVDQELIDVAARRSQLQPAPPPGASSVVQSRSRPAH